ncbi:MAG: helix-turn-helix transcriptional regulator [Bacilli bacterium]|nr:helix-turn-helix transcriptional regulator [Bacilli bacterium]
MRFCDKLPKLRKENNLSQEQLADKLGVSRQAVSKWESGASYPDMDKIMSLCKILNCSLDQLIDDGAMKDQINGQPKENKFNINLYLKEMLDFITKTANMFWSMRLVEKIKCILEMGFVLLIIIIIYFIIGGILNTLFLEILILLPKSIYILLEKIGVLLYSVFCLAIGAITFIHIFKIRYLDYFVTIEDSEVNKKSIEKPVDEQEDKKERVFIEKNKNKIIIRDPKHTTYSFFYCLAKIVLMFLKSIAVICLIMAILSMVSLVILIVFSITYIKYGTIFIGTTLATISCIAINYLILELLYNFIFNQKYHFKRTFIIFMSSLILTGIGIGMSVCAYLSYQQPDYDSNRYKTETREIEYSDNLVLEEMEDPNVELISDNSRNNIKIDFIIPKDANIRVGQYTNNDAQEDDSIENNNYEVINYYHWNLDYYVDSIEGFNLLLDQIKNKERVGSSSYKIKIYASDNTLNLLKDNYSKHYYYD